MTGFAFAEPITVITRARTGRDEYGNPVYSESSLAASGAFVPAIGSEATGDKDQVTSQPQALFQGPDATRVAAVIDSTSKLVIRGKSYEVAGEDQDWKNPFTGWAGGLVVPLKRETG